MTAVEKENNIIRKLIIRKLIDGVPDMMEHSYHYLAMASHALLQQLFFEGLRQTGLTPGQPKILDFLRENEGAEQKEVARACHIKGATCTVILIKMEEQGLVERRMLHGNRRSLYIFLTPKGRQTAQLVWERFELLEKEVFSVMKPAEKEMFMEQLERLYKRLRELEEENSAVM